MKKEEYHRLSDKKKYEEKGKYFFNLIREYYSKDMFHNLLQFC